MAAGWASPFIEGPSELVLPYLFLRACLEAAFDSEKRQFFGETRRLFEERTQRYGQKKQRSITKKVAFAAQRVASKQALSAVKPAVSAIAQSTITYIFYVLKAGQSIRLPGSVFIRQQEIRG
ncbi:MAG: hypothetical protein H6564_00635 [Lewinellaceae bacterium]|nr:hypothetical protein [Lewinellaceae bacterium]